MLTPGQIMIFEEQQDVDFAFSWATRPAFGARFTQRGQTGPRSRVIPTRIPSFDELGLPSRPSGSPSSPAGFVIVTGPTGSGKSTTLASIIDRINETRAATS